MIAKVTSLFGLFFLLSQVSSAQTTMSVEHEEDEHEDGHHDHFHTNEIGISFAPVYYWNKKDSPIYFGLHSHYVRRLGESRFGIGAGYEYIFDEHKHQTFSAVFQFSPTYRFHLVAAPGWAIESEEEGHDDHGAPQVHHEEEEHGASFALHLEAVYEFELGPIDIGPSFEFAWDKHDVHLSLGAHLAFPF